MAATDHDLASALADAARAITTRRSLEETLNAIVQAAQRSVPGVDEIGISIAHADGTIETKAASGPLVLELDELQYALNEGPCVTAIREGRVVFTEDIRNDSRWPRFGPRAAEAGLESQLGVQLWADQQTLGGLNLYSLQPASINQDSIDAAELFATHAALALGRARAEEEFHQGMESRGIIGTAIGIIMERHRIDDQRAFQFLTRVSMTSNTRMRVVAQEVVDSAVAGYPAES